MINRLFTIKFTNDGYLTGDPMAKKYQTFDSYVRKMFKKELKKQSIDKSRFTAASAPNVGTNSSIEDFKRWLTAWARCPQPLEQQTLEGS